MSYGSIEVIGLNQLVRTLRQAGHDLGDLKQASARAGQTVSQWAAVTAPRRTGALGGAVRSSARASTAVIRAGSSGVPYAGPIHWGWGRRHIAANPWVSRAAQDTQPAWLPAYVTDVQRALDKVKGA